MSGFDWNKSAEGGDQAEKIPAGEGIPVTISKIVYGKKGGAPFRSKGGDPQIMLIFQDADEREAALMVTLSAKAAWVLSRIMGRFGVDLDGLKAEGIQPDHFAEPTFANARLVGLSGKINLAWKQDGYPEIEPCEVQSQLPSSMSATLRTGTPIREDGPPTLNEGDIPF